MERDALLIEQCRPWSQGVSFAHRGGTRVPIIQCGSNEIGIPGLPDDPLTKLLRIHGAVMLRGLDLPDAGAFQAFVSARNELMLRYDFASSPRHRVRAGIFSSTDYPAHETIPQHNEQSYTTTWPGLVWFYCEIAPVERGATPLADSRQVLHRIPSAVRRQFLERGIAYVRNLGTGLDLPWAEVFGTSKRNEVERYCAGAEITCQWIGADQLRTHQRGLVEISHPFTGQTVWFNQAHLFHVSALSSDISELLLTALGEENLPRNVYFQDGQAIPDESLAAVRTAYDASKLVIPWQQGDVLLLDNMLMSHGREPFSGARRILVSMSDPHRFDRNANKVVPADEPAQAWEVVT